MIGNAPADNVREFLRDLIKFSDTLVLPDGSPLTDYHIDNLSGQDFLLMPKYGPDIPLRLDIMFGTTPVFANVMYDDVQRSAPDWFKRKYKGLYNEHNLGRRVK